MQTLILMRRFPSSPLDFASMQPYGPDVASACEEARVAIEQEVKAAMQSYDDVGGFFVVPQGSHLVQARVA